MACKFSHNFLTTKIFGSIFPAISRFFCLISRLRLNESQLMADNYLEKKMEDYLNPRRTARHVSARKGALAARRALVAGGSVGAVAPIVEALVARGCRVAFCCPAAREGTSLAQRLGARFYPMDVAEADAADICLDDLMACWGGVDALIAAEPDRLSAMAMSLERCLNPLGVSSALLLTRPGGGC
jgi:hypothetical protein